MLQVWESISKALHLLGLLPYLDRLLLFTRLYSAVLYAIRSRPCTCQNIICVSLGLSESKLSEEGRSPYTNSTIMTDPQGRSDTPDTLDAIHVCLRKKGKTSWSPAHFD